MNILGFCSALFVIVLCRQATHVKQRMLNKPKIFIISRVLISYLLQMVKIQRIKINTGTKRMFVYEILYTHKKQICLFELKHSYMKTHAHINNYASSMFSCLNKSEMCTIRLQILQTPSFVRSFHSFIRLRLAKYKLLDVTVFSICS